MGGIDILRAWCMWNGLIVGVLTIVGFFIHFFNPTRAGITPCVPIEDALDCIGGSLRWATGGNTVGDVNQDWRKTFTFKPQDFIDLWTPLFGGLFQVLQHFGEATRSTSLSGSWLNVGIFNAILAFWAQFGYAGNFGVFVGFYTTCGWLPFVLVCIFCDKTNEPCVLDLGDTLGLSHSAGDGDDDGGAADDAAEEDKADEQAEVHGNEA